MNDIQHPHAETPRRARTVAVELPTIKVRHEIQNGNTRLQVSSVGGATYLNADGDSFVVNPDELKPLGEYLLALHYEKEQQ